MKIAYVMQQGAEIRHAPFDGPAIHVRHVVEELQARGHTVCVLAGLDGKIWRSDDLTRFTEVQVRRADQGLPRLLERVLRRLQRVLRLPFLSYFDSKRFAEAILQELPDADVLYERMSWMSYGAGLAAKRLRRPLVLEFNGDHLHDLQAKGIAPQGLQRRIALWLMQAAVARSAFVVASGKGWHAAFLKRYAYPAERVRTIENGTTLLRLLQRDDLRAFRPQDAHAPLTIAYLGGFMPWQGVEVLLRVFARLRARGVQANLLLIGTGGNLPACQSLAQTLGVADHVHFAGQRPAEEYASLLAAADIGTSPYCGWKEYSGMKLFDYKAAGLAIVASGEHGQPDTLTHASTALIVPPCDEAALEAALWQLANDAAYRRQMGQTARLEAEQRHGWDQTAAQIEAVFEIVRKGAA